MIKEQIKCPKCGKVLLRGYSMAVTSVTCRCGKTIDLRKNLKKMEETYAKR